MFRCIKTLTKWPNVTLKRRYASLEYNAPREPYDVIKPFKLYHNNVSMLRDVKY